MSSNTITLVGRYSRKEQEFTANAALSPGHLLEVLSTGKVKKHATAAGVSELMFAQEDALQGKTITDAYIADDKVFVTFPLKGDEINALIKAGQNLTVGIKLISAGDGTLIDVADGATAVTDLSAIAICIEAIDLTATGAVATHAAVRIL